jgi:hypothetical protein
VWISRRDPTRRVLTILEPSFEVRSTCSESPFIMSSVNVPSSSLAMDTSAICTLPHAHVHSTHCVQKNIRAEAIELSEANARRTPSVRAVEVDVSETRKRLASRARIQFVSLCWAIFLVGWSDGSAGPMLPRIQKNYHVPCLSLCLKSYDATR